MVPRTDLLRLYELAGYGDGPDAAWLRRQAVSEVETVGPGVRELVAEVRAAQPAPARPVKARR